MLTFLTWTPYCGAAPVPAEWLSRWNFDPLLLAGLLVSGFAIHRLNNGDRRLALAALLLTGIVFVSPFCALTSALFAARVVHHVVLAAVVAPLIAWSLPRRLGVPGSLAMWTALHAVIFWAWHVPAVYAAALSNDVLFWLLQGLLLGSGVGFWWRVRRAPAPAAAAALLATTVQMGLLGALITFAGRPLYAPHFATTLAWGWTKLEDQQLGGLIMWAPAAALYLLIAVILFGRWLEQEHVRASAPA